MFTKLAIFGLGYLLGTRAGRERYQAIVKEAREFVQGEEVAAAVGFVRGAFWILSQRGKGLGRRAPYASGEED
ncbi:MAG: hypothetical protein LBJ87_05900 [bacterium]|jgi:hypothetical protein|nr:hypothetical protein [bacterium]